MNAELVPRADSTGATPRGYDRPMSAYHDRPRIDVPAAERKRVLASMGEALACFDSVKFAAVFGSFARGEPAGDIDVAVWFIAPPDMRELGRLHQALDEAGVPGLACEVVSLNSAPPRLRFAAVMEGVAIFERTTGDWTSFYARSVVEWNDVALSLRLAGHPVGSFPKAGEPTGAVTTPANS